MGREREREREKDRRKNTPEGKERIRTNCTQRKLVRVSDIVVWVGRLPHEERDGGEREKDRRRKNPEGLEKIRTNCTQRKLV